MTSFLLPRADYGTTRCTLDTCPITDSYWNYRPSLAANATFLALFSLSLACFLLQYILSRRFAGFTIAFACGCVIEILGYAGRLMSYHDPFSENGFLMQICCLTIGPAFFAAGIYLTISRIVTIVGPENSRIPPRAYPWIFIPCDILSLVLQGTGGGMASVASHNNRSPDNGDHIMVAGLSFQVFTLLVFMLLSVDFAVRTYIRRRSNGGSGSKSSPGLMTQRGKLRFRGFLAALSLATLCIFIRSVYRVVELSEGWNGALIKNQGLFIGLEGVMVIVACLLLNVWWPGWCLPDVVQEREGGVVEYSGKDAAITSEREV